MCATPRTPMPPRFSHLPAPCMPSVFVLGHLRRFSIDHVLNPCAQLLAIDILELHEFRQLLPDPPHLRLKHLRSRVRYVQCDVAYLTPDCYRSILHDTQNTSDVVSHTHYFWPR